MVPRTHPIQQPHSGWRHGAHPCFGQACQGRLLRRQLLKGKRGATAVGMERIDSAYKNRRLNPIVLLIMRPKSPAVPFVLITDSNTG